MLNKCNFCQISLNKLFLNRIKFHFKTCKIFIYRFQSWQYSIYMINLNHQKIVVVQSLSCVQLFCNPMNCRMPGFPSFTISQSSLKLMSIESVIPSHPLVPPSPPALNLSQHQGFFFFFPPISWLFASGGQSIGALASVPPVNIQGWFPLGLTSFDLLAVQWTSQVSSPAQFESIISSALSFPYGPTFTSVHDYWKNHSFDCIDLCQQSDVSAF